MVFPIGACVWELAADHLDRLPGKSLLQWLIQQRCVAENDNAAGANQPHDGAEGRRNQTNRDRNDVQTGVQLGGCEASLSDFEVLAVELANDVHAGNNEDDVEQEPGVGEEGIDAEHHENDGIVAGEVTQVEIDARLDLSEVLRLRHALDVEELRDRAEVGKAA